MNGKEFNYVRDTIDNEGFLYAFIDYSSFEEIKDIEFHRLRQDFIEAYSNLANYLGYEKL